MTTRFAPALQTRSSRSGMVAMAFALLVGCGPEEAEDTGAGGDASVVEADGASGAPTWNDDIAPLVQASCSSCHHAGGAASPDFSSYEDTARWAEIMAISVESGAMPPSNVDASGDCQDFLDARWLTDEEIALVRAWADAGAPLGQGEPAVATPPEPALLAEVDASLAVAIDQPLPDVGEQWRCFVVETDGISQRWLTGYQVTAQDPSLVHHATIRTLNSLEAVEMVRELDAADAAAGYACESGVVPDSTIMALHNAGTPATTFPEGTGVQFTPGQPLLVEVHYSGSGVAGLSVELDLADSVERRAQVLGFDISRFALPPGEEYVEQSADLVLPGSSEQRVTLYGVNPHMHDYGVTQRFELEPDDEATCLSSTVDFRADWQQIHWYAEPVEAQGGQPVRVTCGYDTTTASGPITVGPSYADEMCTALVYAVIE